MIYSGSPAKHLPYVATLILARLAGNFRCLYLSSPEMVEGIRSQLAATGVDVAEEIRRGSLILSSDQSHLVDGRFEVAGMLAMLEEAVRRALSDGYRGLFATGDMTWEFGSDHNFDRLLEYEMALEQLFQRLPHLSGVCQYHQESLPADVVRTGLYAHRGLYINETLSHLNPNYADPDLLTRVDAERSATQVSERLSLAGIPDK